MLMKKDNIYLEFHQDNLKNYLTIYFNIPEDLAKGQLLLFFLNSKIYQSIILKLFSIGFSRKHGIFQIAKREFHLQSN